ncbi:MAG: PcfK-like family protein [Prevotella sp.]|nr:PcfK-like family protein [Prevotella sp.]
MDFKNIIKAHLDKMAQQDFAFAERYKREDKSLDKCINYITSQAKKQAKNGCAAIEDAVVYGWAVHYYQEDDIKVEEVKAAKVVAPKTEKPKEIKPLKALVKDKKDENKCVQLDLFGGF